MASSIARKEGAVKQPEFVVVWRGVRVWTVRARDIDEAARTAARVTGRPERELGVAMVPDATKEKK